MDVKSKMKKMAGKIGKGAKNVKNFEHFRKISTSDVLKKHDEK